MCAGKIFDNHREENGGAGSVSHTSCCVDPLGQIGDSYKPPEQHIVRETGGKTLGSLSFFCTINASVTTLHAHALAALRDKLRYRFVWKDQHNHALRTNRLLLTIIVVIGIVILGPDRFPYLRYQCEPR